jgi:hypothetical protein
VFEAVTSTQNNYNVIHKEEQKASKSKKNAKPILPLVEHFQAPLITFGNFAQRAEERMNFSVNIEMFTDLNKSIKATTIDVSVNGLKVKAHKEHLFKPKERVSVQFCGLETDYGLEKRLKVSYEVSSISRNDFDQRITLRRLFDPPNPTFDRFFENFIQGNKRRYKVNLENTLTAIQNKTYEQYYIPNFSSIPIFIAQEGSKYVPKYALANDSNREEIQYWANELLELRIGYLLTEARIQQALLLPKGRQEIFVFVFNNIKNDKVHFYSASHQELDAQPDLKNLFLGYGSRKASWRVYKLQFTEMDPQQSYKPLSIGNSINDTVKRQNQKPSPRLMSRLKDLGYIAVVTNITDPAGTEQYQAHKIKREELNKLKVFGHPRNKPPAMVDAYRFKYFNQRRETRFLLNTPVQIKIGSQIINGHTEDFSTLGLKIELDSHFNQVEETKVVLSFPKLQAVTKKYNLTALPYVVKKISRDHHVIHLQNMLMEEKNTARAFFEALIKGNRSKLKAYRDEEEVSGIGEALRNIYADNVLNVAYFLRKDSIDIIPDAAATFSMDNRLSNLLNFQAQPEQINLYPLFRNASSRHDFISPSISKTKPNEKPKMEELFVAFDPSKEQIGQAIHSQFSHKFSSQQARKDFIHQALRNGQFIALKVFLARTGRPDIEHMRSELKYISIYAVHKAKLLEEQLWNVIAMGDIVDVTDEVLQRYEFQQGLILENQLTPAHHKTKKVGIEQLLST